ncbi:MAG: RNA methyltransferase [Acidimicrobiales bacterium]|nr:RNA methyltransferase [Acidimicrobiales bacterium]
MTEEVSGRNPRIQRMRRLVRDRGFRYDEAAYVVEGPSLVAEALDAGREVRQVVVPSSAASHQVLHRAGWSGAATFVVPDGVFEGLSSTRSPQPALAEVAFHDAEPADLATTTGPLLVLAEVSDPGNAGTLFRSAEAFGATGVVVAGGVDPYNPKLVRAAAGSTFRLPFALVDDPLTALRLLCGAGYGCWATVPRGGIPPAEVSTDGPVALVLGNEPHGLSEEVVGACEGVVSIPTVGGFDSLNVAIAGSVALHDLVGRSLRGDGA